MEQWIDIIAAGAGGLALAFFGLNILFHGSRAKQTREVNRLRAEKLREEIRLLQDARQKAAEGAPGWNGWRKFEVAKKVQESSDICSFYLKPHDRKPIPSFKPGQYLTFNLDIPGERKPVVRCYSLSDCPHPDYYRVSIKRVPAPKSPPGLSPGKASTYFHDNIHEGDILDVKSPSGHFFFDTPSPRPVILIGGGIGVTPVISMLRELSKEKDGRKIFFYYGVRNGREHVLRDEMIEAAKANPDVELVICYSKPDPEDVEGVHYTVESRVSVDLFKSRHDANNYDFYLCGPPPMMSALTEDLQAWGVPKKHVHYETFGPSTVKSTTRPPIPMAKTTGETSSKVTFQRSGVTLPWTGIQTSILELAEEEGIEMAAGCRAGNCGTCLVAVNSGKFKHVQDPGFEAEDGSCLACIAVPDGELTINA
ncbi:MAG: 2Fe-2S iron-sulfur cluster-binding protein [Opitutales bacterium]